METLQVVYYRRHQRGVIRTRVSSCISYCIQNLYQLYLKYPKAKRAEKRSWSDFLKSQAFSACESAKKDRLLAQTHFNQILREISYFDAETRRFVKEKMKEVFA